MSTTHIAQYNRDVEPAQYPSLATYSECSDHEDPPEHGASTKVQELGVLLRFSIPLILTYLLRYSVGFTSSYLIGADGWSSVAALSLGNAIAATTGFAFFDGLAGGLDTIFSHAYGSRRYHTIGIYAQRFCCLGSFACIFIALLWFLSGMLLDKWGVDAQVTSLCSSYLRILILALPGYVCFEVGKRWVLVMGHPLLPLYVSLVTTPVQFVLCHVFVRQFRWGIEGAATATVIYHILNPLLLLLLVRYSQPGCLIAWPGFSKLAFRDWKPLISLCLPCVVTMEAEWIMYDILSYSASYLRGPADSAFSIVAVLSSILYQIPLSASICASLRVGVLLGQGHTNKIPEILTLYTTFGTSVGLLNGALLIGLKDTVAPLFTKSRQTQALIEGMGLAFGLVALFDTTTAMTNGVIRGVGKQHVGIWFNLVGQHLIALPFAMFWTFGPVKLEMTGLWIGVTCGACFITCSQGAYLWRRRCDFKGLQL